LKNYTWAGYLILKDGEDLVRYLPHKILL